MVNIPVPSHITPTIPVELVLDSNPPAMVQCNETETVTPPRGLRRAFHIMIDLYKRGKPWMLVVCGNDSGVRVHETLPPRWESK